MKNQQMITWDETLHLYSEFCDRPHNESYDASLKEFRRVVVEKAVKSVWAQYLFASQSLLTLIISTKEKWPDRILSPHLQVKPTSDNEVIINLFDSPKHRGDPGVPKVKIVCKYEAVFIHLEPLMKNLTEHMNSLSEDK